jgi:putative addiction module component (TIGR02574 family)
MSVSANGLLEEALKLPEDERDALAVALLDSIHGQRDEGDVVGGWASEIRRRVDDYRAGRIGAVPWTALRDELAARAHRG